jgi:hypothetical protein
MTAWQPIPDLRPTRTHECSKREEVTRSGSGTASPSPREWGESVTAIIELEGTWWAVSGDPPEYSTPIQFCPWCGVDLKTLI